MGQEKYGEMNCEDAISYTLLLNMMTLALVIVFVYFGLWGMALSSVSDDHIASIFREPEDENENDKIFSNSQDNNMHSELHQNVGYYRECKSGGNILVFYIGRTSFVDTTTENVTVFPQFSIPPLEYF